MLERLTGIANSSPLSVLKESIAAWHAALTLTVASIRGVALPIAAWPAALDPEGGGKVVQIENVGLGCFGMLERLTGIFIDATMDSSCLFS